MIIQSRPRLSAMQTNEACPTPTSQLNTHMAWLAVALLLIAGSILNGAFQRMTSAPGDTREARAIAQHCSEFIALAKATYGDEWKVRLDPRNVACQGTIQREWERTRVLRPQLAAPASITVFNAPPPAAVEMRRKVPASTGDTYCLNLISLAKARYGADWSREFEAPPECRQQVAGQ